MFTKKARSMKKERLKATKSSKIRSAGSGLALLNC